MLQALFVLIVRVAWPCQISSLGNGDCVASKNVTLNFCKGKVEPFICLPQSQQEWNWTALDKEVSIRQAYLVQLEKIIELEVGGTGGEFSKNIECTNTLKAVMCQINFPYCLNGTSYAVCSKGCQYLKENCLTTVDICELSEYVVPNISYCSLGFILHLTCYFIGLSIV